MLNFEFAMKGWPDAMLWSRDRSPGRGEGVGAVLVIAFTRPPSDLVLFLPARLTVPYC